MEKSYHDGRNKHANIKTISCFKELVRKKYFWNNQKTIKVMDITKEV